MSTAEELRALYELMVEELDHRIPFLLVVADEMDQAAAELDETRALALKLERDCAYWSEKSKEQAAELDRLRAVIQRGIDWLPADERGKVYDWKVEAKQALEHPR